MKKLLLLLIIIAAVGCSKDEDFNFYRYEVYGSSDNYEVTFRDINCNVHELKDVGNSTIYEFSTIGKAKVYFSAQNVVDGYIVISVYKNGVNIRNEYTDGAENRIVIDGTY